MPEGGSPLVPVRLRFAAEAAQILQVPAPPTLTVPRDRAAAARVILGLDSDGFTVAPAQVIVRESA